MTPTAAALLAFMLALAACGNVSRPLAYTASDAPLAALAPLPTNQISAPPVATNSRITNGL